MNTIPLRPFAALKLATLAVLALVLLLLNSCHWVGVQGNGHIVTDTRAVPPFSRIEANGALTVNWTAGAPSLSITTDENLLQYLRTEVSDGTLKIEWEKALRGTRGIKVNLTSPDVSHVQLNGAVRFLGSKLAGRELYLEANGATRVELQGTVNALSAELNGASRLHAESLVTRAMELSISGAGRAEVNVTEALKVDISGAGKVVYSGEPKTVSKNISGAGSIKKRD